MCNLYSLTTAAAAMRDLFGVARDHDRLGNHQPLPAIFPRYEAPVVRQHDGARELVRMHWGFLMPQVSKKTGEPILPRAITNARDDKVLTSKFWRESFEVRRCLIPASSFCEPKGRAPATYHWFALAGEEARPPFAFAGLWRGFRGRYRGDLVELETYTMLTTRPNELVRPIHPDRMPVILDPADYETWLTGTAEDAHALLRTFPAERMRIVREGLDEKEDEV